MQVKEIPMNNLMRKITEGHLNKDITQFKTGNTVRVYLKILEGNNERTQIFEGVIIARSGTGVSETFTIRRVSYGIGMEMTFPVHSPRLEKIKVLEESKARRAKLYYLRND